jgi:hypothetical protein
VLEEALPRLAHGLPSLRVAWFLLPLPPDRDAFSFVGYIMPRVHRRAPLDLDALRHGVDTVAANLRHRRDRLCAKLHRVPVLLEDAHDVLDEVRYTLSLLADDPGVVCGRSTDRDC